MPKPTLSDSNPNASVDAPEAETPQTEAAAELPETPDTNATADSDADESTVTAEADDVSDADSSAGPSEPTEATAKTLADFRSAFGHEQGSVYFADGTPFEDACSAHIGTLNGTIAEQATKIEELTALNKTLAASVHGEADPLPLGSDSPDAHQDGVARFASSLKLPNAKA